VAKKWWKLLFTLQIILSAALLFLINYSIIWWVVIAGSAIILILGTIKKNLFDGRWMALPMFFFVISLFFLLLSPQINLLPQKPNEVFLSQKTGLDIAAQTVKANPIFGSGPGTFAYDFSKFKSPNFSSSSFWNVTFNNSSSKVLNSLATTGFLGLLAMLAFMVFPLFCGIKFFMTEKETGDVVLLLGLAVVVAAQSIAYFLYNSNTVLDFVCFFAIAALIGFISNGKKEYALKSSSLFNLITTFVFTLIFIFGMGLLILDGQRYFAEVNYYKALVAYQSGQKTDGLKKLESSASLNPKSDLYFRQLSQAYLLELQDELQGVKGTISDQEKAKIQTLMSNSINAGKTATDINPQDVSNWSLRGYIYQSLLGISNDAGTWAISSYDSALKLDPNNPYLFAQEGIVYFTDAASLQADQKNQLLAKAETQLEKAVALNPSYSNALYFLGLVYDSLGQKDKAINTFTKIQQLNPANTDISKILDNLNAGRQALQAATTPPVETPPNGTNGAAGNPPAKAK